VLWRAQRSVTHVRIRCFGRLAAEARGVAVHGAGCAAAPLLRGPQRCGDAEGQRAGAGAADSARQPRAEHSRAGRDQPAAVPTDASRFINIVRVRTARAPGSATARVCLSHTASPTRCRPRRFVGSTLSEKAVANTASYVTAKHAMVGLMRATCQDLAVAAAPVHTAAICPGFTGAC
jgi:NAD(P)-dependent dehydrogenase (short-subunit alcohol dehydrogenase family)